jgi:hypothetical protein
MTHFVELEIGLQKIEGAVHVALRLDRSDSEADVSPVLGVAAFDAVALQASSSDGKRYGQLLAQQLFADDKVKARFEKAAVMAESLDVPLRLRISIDRTAAELHTFAWESLCDPSSGELLATKEQLLFSRFISSQDWRPVHLRAKDELRALVAIANPANLSDYQPGGRPLPPVDLPGETKRATASLGIIPVTPLGGGGAVTLNNVVGRLREGYDIFELVCHGAFVNGEPVLYLEDETGEVAVVHGTELVTNLSELKQRPRLVVLVSCQSAGTGVEPASADQGVLSALGPRLAEAGIPAVIAMQGDITMKTAEELLKVFFQELQRDGQIDRAMSAARGAVRARSDWWVPVLFMCLKSGRIWWYTPGFAGEQPGFDRWAALVNNIKQCRCTPILGSGLLESYVGSFRQIARQWAQTYLYPMAGEERDELPLVAQYLTVDQEEAFVRDKYCEALRSGVLRQYPEIGQDLAGGPLERLISAAGAIRRNQEPVEPHDVLASLNLPVYLSTNPDNLLFDALLGSGTKRPAFAVCPESLGRNDAEMLKRQPRGGRRQRAPKEREEARDDTEGLTPEEAQHFEPTADRPLVYHLFGHLRDVYSIVLTQDDYFDYLIDVTRNNDIIPTFVRAQLTNTALLFLGFQLSDWDFRVFFRSIMSQEGRSRRGRYSHVAVQIDPEQDRLLDTERARRYLERYFSGANIGIFWGRAEDFLKQLLQQMKKYS